MAAMRGSVLATMVLLSSWAAIVSAQLWQTESWANAHCTFYGGTDASGTMGGACGYGNLYSTGYGTDTAALSNALFNDGLSCGACFELQCIQSESSYCYPGKSLIVTATNNCPQGSFGGWCDAPKAHFDLAYPAFIQLGPEVAGVLPVQFRRVMCNKSGGIRFTITGNPFFVMVLVQNVGGLGDVASVSMEGSGMSPVALAHNWGQIWSSGANVVGKSITFIVTLGSGDSKTFSNVAGSNWGFGQTYEAGSNF
ncbi:unnamed protein product [Calypogeia fissa]